MHLFQAITHQRNRAVLNCLRTKTTLSVSPSPLLQRAHLQSFWFSTSTQHDPAVNGANDMPSSTRQPSEEQDDFFDKVSTISGSACSNGSDPMQHLIKIDELRQQAEGQELLGGSAPDEEFEYEGRLSDRVTEEEYTTENLMTYDQKFSDKVRVWTIGGSGGNGCVSHQRENYGFKIPDGGSGGKGGDVYFKATARLANLYELRRAHFKGNNGKPGRGEESNGTNGKDIQYSVPVGTEIYEIKRNVSSKKQAKALGAAAKRDDVRIKVADLDHEGQTIRMAKGGAGGMGNLKDKQIRILEKGYEGENKEYELRLKVIADIGFIGYPNAGKSTLLSALTRAFPKIAHYPFTTLRPYIGQVKFVDDTKLVLADLPGIIEGAHVNRGLGHAFLQHAERTKVLLFVIDGGVADENRTPLKDFRVLQEELRLYKDGLLLQKPQVLAVNKSDRKYTNFNKRVQAMSDSVDIPMLPISAKEGTNLELLLEMLKELVDQEKLKSDMQEPLTLDSNQTHEF